MSLQAKTLNHDVNNSYLMEGKRGSQRVRLTYLGSKEKTPGLIRKENKANKCTLTYRLFL